MLRDIPSRRLALVLYLVLVLVSTTFSQISHGGKPRSISHLLKSEAALPVINLSFAEDFEMATAVEQIEQQGPYAVALGHPVDIKVNRDGQWESVPGEGRICRLRIRSTGASALHLFFEEFVLPDGAELFIYNRGMQRILGAFTSATNKPSGKLALQPVPGDEVTIEYFEPLHAAFSPALRISNVGHNFREGILQEVAGYGDSERCNRDINCSQAADWQTEKRAVCKILFKKSSGNWFICTGALINTTSNDGRPYFLTANHCIPSNTEAESMVLYFNYESPTCNGPDGDNSQTISGTSILATTYRLDFSLVELSEAPPDSYYPYYAGWDISEEAAEKVVSIHHPQGDVKKFSQYNKMVETGDFTYLYDYDDNTHWYIDDWSLGITEGGSSGSPLFNQDHRIVGDLTGGSSVSNCTSSDAYYAKISHSWDDYPNASTQLKYWLDPDSTGQTFMDGYDPLVSTSTIDKIYHKPFEVYPNPANNQVYIRSNHSLLSSWTIEILDLSGKSLFKQEVNPGQGQIRINLHPDWEGIYLISHTTGETKHIEKLIIY